MKVNSVWQSLALLAMVSVAGADDWPQFAGPERDGVWREMGIVERFSPDMLDGDRLKRQWRVAIGGGYAGPAAADGRVYVTDRIEDKDVERVLCLDATSGELVWKHEYDCSYAGIDYPAGPRATPTVYDGRVYALGARGHLFCFSAADGKIHWSKHYEKDYGARVPKWGHAAGPLIDGRQLIITVGGKDGAGVLSLDRKTGEEIWRSMDLTDIGYCSPRIFEAGGMRQMIYFHPEGVASLDPATGKKYWEVPFHTDYGVTISSPVMFDDKLWVSQFWGGPLVLRFASDKPEATEVWRNPPDADPHETAINSLMCTPIIRDGYIYGVAGYGALRCIKADKGETVWETHDATGKGRWWNAFLIPNGDRCFIANEQGDLIIARLTPKGYDEISRAKLIVPTNKAMRRDVVWSPPAFANKHIIARNDKEIISVDLGQP